MFAHCEGALWKADDFSRCFQQEFLRTLFPLVACGASLLFLIYQSVRTIWLTRTRGAYAKVQSNGLSHRGQGQECEEEDDEDEDEIEDEFDTRRNEEEVLQMLNSRLDGSKTAVNKPRGEVLIAVVEELAVLANLGIQLALLLRVSPESTPLALGTGVATWAYIAILTSFRLLFSSTSRLSFPKLWYHTAVLYGVQWLLTSLIFRSHIIHPRARFLTELISTNFALSTLLLLISLTSRKGNRAVELHYEGDLEPSREPLASVLSLATFSWVDAIVWRGYKAPFEMPGVWNLMPKDKAAAILADYRQVKKTTILAFHLLKYFQRGFIVQALWAVISGAITFVPTLLLKVILQYVEDPSSTPRNAAWFYVILLFVSGVINALSSGQALWVGRKICIRIRAIIIGEIYAKALRRRAAAGSDKILGQDKKTSKKDDDDSKQSMLNKVLSFGLKKKSASSKSDATDKKEESDDSQVTSGAIINLMAVDSFKVAELTAYFAFLMGRSTNSICACNRAALRVPG
nr:atp-dependent bile acid permease [Quercus suber]